MLSEGITTKPEYHIQVLQNRLAQLTIREAQMEAAVQQLIAENQRLEATMQAMKEAAEEQIEQEG
jgi:hypothetical protein